MNAMSRLKTAVMVFFAVMLSARPVYAEDIEIYLVSGNESGGANVLLLIDTSGGTNRNFPGTQFSEGGKTIDEISYALRLVVDGLAGNTRAGVASQLAGGDNGGAINYPVKQIDEKTAPVGFGKVISPAGDAFQFMQVPGPLPMAVDDPMVSWKAFPNLTDDPDADGDNMTLPMPSILSTTDLENVVGLQLAELAVPRYAQVNQALLTLRSPSADMAGFRLRIAHEMNSAPEPFSVLADFPSRKWSLPFDSGGTSFNAKGQLSAGVITIDVTDVVQAAVRDPFWCGGQTLSLLIQATDIPLASVPKIYSYRAEDAVGARLGITELEVQWSDTGMVGPVSPVTGDDALSCMGGVTLALAANADDGTETTTNKNLQTGDNELVLQEVTGGPAAKRGIYVGGARFASVGFPKDTKVKSAVMQGRFTAVSGAGAVMRVKPMLGNVPAFDTAGAIAGRPVGANYVDVAAAAGDFSADVTTLINEIFADAGWLDSQALGLRLERWAGTSISVHALDNGAASALILKMDVLAPKPTDFVSTFSRRDEIKKAVDKFSNATGGGKNKPASAYAEAGRYMLGIKPEFGISDGHTEAFADGARSRYLSPSESYDECGGNHIIMVTHAESSGESFKPSIDAITGVSDCPGDANTDAWTCSAVLASYLADGARNSSGIPIQTHTVAFAPSKAETYAGLKLVADAGGGQYRESQDAQELAAVLSELINKLTTTDASMAAPGVAVNQLNRFRHLDQLYYALFRPSFESRWLGNLKRYRLDFDTQQIVDEKGNPAVDPDTGFFKATSNSWWGQDDLGADLDDGQNVALGGTRYELLGSDTKIPSPRRLLVSTSSPAAGGSDTATSAPLGVGLTQVSTTADVTPEQLGMPAGSPVDEVQQRLDLLLKDWGDPLHSEPRLVNFGFTGTFEEAMLDDSKQDNTVFVSTNDGMMHAIEPKTGEELFSFMPHEELIRTESRFQVTNLDAADPQRSTYGLDGGITVWRRSKADGSGDPEHVFLYLSQRRGGNTYYALNVTDRSSPRLMWKIQGGSAPFDKLGQTWSQPTLAQIALNGVRVPVLVFGGGYSPADHDTAGTVSTDDVLGNAIYIVNAFNGELIWSVSRTGESANHADMKWAIPSSASVVDIDFDGVIDYIYAADMGGQVFRIDLNNANTGVASLVKRVATLAKLGTSDAAGIDNHRRFHAAPVVALNSRDDGEQFLQVALGSGYRAHPLNMDTSDFIFMIDDIDALKDTDTGTVTRADMVDVTNDTNAAATLFDGKRGWYIKLETGEKVLSSGVISNGVLFMSTYLPESAFINKCQRVVGSSRLYAMGLLNGGAVLDLNNDGSVNRSVDLVLPGLPPSPQLLLDGAGNQVVLIGTQALSGGTVGGGKGVRKTRWFEVPTEAAAEEELIKAMQGK